MILLVSTLMLFAVLSASQDATRCPGPADVVIMVQGSKSIPHSVFELLEKLLTKFLNYFVIDEQEFRVGLILFGRRPVVMNGLHPFKNRTQLNTMISLMAQRELHGNMLDGKLDIEAAINEMRSLFTFHTLSAQLNNEPVPSKKIGILLAYADDSLPPVGSSARKSVISTTETAKQEGTTLYTVVAGSGATDLLNMATDECKMFAVKGVWNGLTELIPDIANTICADVSRKYTGSAERDAFGNCVHMRKYQPPEPVPFTCQHLSGIYNDPENCAYYYTCSSGRSTRNRCLKGDLFDTHSHTCNHKNAVTCYSEISCPAPNGLFPHPADCHSFLNCFRGIPYIQKCSKGLIFDARWKLCLRTWETICKRA